MESRPPLRSAVMLSLAIWGVLLFTVAPSVTFWDAGEFITAARTLGIPHPPGSPLYVLIANCWGRFFALGSWAWRINSLSAACAAAAAGCWFLVIHDTVQRLHADVDAASRNQMATLAAASGACMTTFAWSMWQSATEAEVYAPAMLAIAMVAALATRWRQVREDGDGAGLLLLALYATLLGGSVHQMALLAGPALVAMVVVSRFMSPVNGEVCRRDASRAFTLGAAWFLGTALVTANALMVVGGIICVGVAMLRARRRGEIRFALAATCVALVAVTPQLFLLLRAQQHPWLNAGMPTDWHGLIDVMRRAQYPVRTPLDDPTRFHGDGNPGRSLTLLLYQFGNFAQYFDWQWAAGFGDLALPSLPRLAVTLLVASVAVRGAFAQRASDAAGFALIAALFVVAGPVLVLYLNFRPGPSMGWNIWAHLADHEVRDRDYFFVAAFAATAVWAAIGLADLVRGSLPRVRASRRPFVVVCFGVAFIPLAANLSAASRRALPEASMAHQFGLALLQSVPQNGILFTAGDNDTFPLWYLQRVEGVRTDVRVICLSLAQARWYVKYLRALDDRSGLPLHSLDPARVDSFRPFRATRNLEFPLRGGISARLLEGDFASLPDVLVIEVLRTNGGMRPVAWSISATDRLFGLEGSLVQQGMVLVLPTTSPDSANFQRGSASGPGGVRLDVATTERLVDGWDFSDLETTGAETLDPNLQAVAAMIARPYAQLGEALLARNDTAMATRYFRRAVQIGNDSAAALRLAHLHH